MTDSLKAPKMKMNNSERLVAAIVSLLHAFAGFVAPCIGANADYCTVTNLWWNGYKTNVLAIAESRLEANTNDIVGIVLKLEYDLSFTYLDDLTNSFPRALDVASRIRTPSFSALYDVSLGQVKGIVYSTNDDCEVNFSATGLSNLIRTPAVRGSTR